MTMDYFEDLRVGDRLELGSCTFTAEDMKAYAARYDPQPCHLDEEAAKRSRFGALCASGWHVSSIAIRMIVRARERVIAGLRARGEPVAKYGPSPGIRDLRWLKPVYPGDTVTFIWEIVELREWKSRPAWGLMSTRVTGTNQNGDPVYSFIGGTFVERRPKQQAIRDDAAIVTPASSRRL